ncbi:MAG: type II secretion system secretin GspD [Betaproteobacteria bacterium]|nr:type II secretion system secretin GspD [Betaproteobacteria bacterium]
MTVFSSLRRPLAALVLAAAFASVSLPCGADDTETVTLNFVNADIDAVIRAVGKITGKNFLIDPRVRGTLNITTQSPVPKGLTYQILLSALRMQGYTAIESKGVVKILPEADAKLHGVPVAKGKTVANGDSIVTEVFQIRNESAAQLVPIIRPLVSPNNTVTAYPGNNTLVITDYAENVARIGKVLASIDVPQGDVRVIPVRNASALDLAATINRLLNEGAAGGGAGDASQRITVLPDARTNSLLVRSDNASKLTTVQRLVSTLDQPGATGNIRVVYLKNAEAVKVAQTLRSVITGDTSASASAGSSGFSATNTNTNSGTNSGSSTGTTTNTATTSTPTSSGGSGNLSGGGMIQADPATNALIITAPEPVYNDLRKVIDQLDRRRAQVYIEALIAEMTSENAAEFGIQWFAGEKPSTNGGSFVGGGTNFGTPTLLGTAFAPGALVTSTGLNIIAGSGTINVPGIGDILNLNILARFLSTQSKANILSTPTLVTLDNEEAKIVVGNQVPFVTGSFTNTGSSTATVNPFQTIERKDVGLTLKVKPQISEGGVVRLLISEETSSVDQTTANNPNGPTTRKRSIDSTVLVDDGAIIALGGLIEDQSSNNASKVPFLGDLPLIGTLFRYDSKDRQKTNLVVFLRPKIIRTPEDYSRLTDARYDQFLKQQLLPEGSENMLAPNFGPPPQLPNRKEEDLRFRPAPAEAPAEQPQNK